MVGGKSTKLLAYKLKKQLEKSSVHRILNLLGVKEAQNRGLIAEITDEEINRAISNLKVGKSPGADGYTADWYRSLKAHLVPLLRKMFNWVLEKGEMPGSWREAIISVIPKEGKDKQDCRLFTAVLAKHLERILPEINHMDQTGFIKGRQTHNNIKAHLTFDATCNPK